MKTYTLISGLLLGAVTFGGAATNDLTTAIQRGLFEEEANQNLGAAIQAYQAAAGQFDKDRKLAATAIFRLGECYRKQGDTNDAATQYERILREFSDQPTLVTLSRQNLAALGSALPPTAAPVLSDAARQEQKRLLEEEIKLVQKQLESKQRQIQMGVAGPDELLPTQREMLELKRRVAALDAGFPISIRADQASAPAISTEADEVKRIQALIQDSPDLINAPDRKEETLLQEAAAKGKLAVVKLLLESGAAVDGLHQPALTPLHYAAANGHKAIVDLLLSKGAKADSHTQRGITPLHLAALKGYETVAKALLTAAAPVNALTTRSENCDSEDVQFQAGAGQTPLHLAANAGYSGMVKLLLAKGADANAEDGDDRTPLSYAAQKHYLAVMQALLAAHANPNAGRAILPLATAAYQGDLPAVKLLLANGADPDTYAMVPWGVLVRGGAYSQGGKLTPLFLAVSQHKAEAVKEMLRCKANLNLPGQGDKPLLYDALADAPTLTVLLDGGSDPNQSVDGTPLLLQAVADRNQAAVELLLAHQADVNAASKAANSEGLTPLQEAARLGSTNIAELLLKAGASVNARDKNGDTPLHFAVLYGQRDMTKLLLDNQADPNERNSLGKTPLDLAKSQTQSGPGQPLARALPYGVPAMGPGMARNPLPITSLRGPGILATAPEPASKLETMADLLRRHGALDDLPHLDQIGVRRSTMGFSNTPFTKNAQDWSQFTLIELIAVQYELLAAGPDQGGGSAYGASTLFGKSQLSFPDLTHLHISRPTADLKGWQDQVVDLSPVMKSGECEKDARLRWGDVVEIPEADHPLNERWEGLSTVELANLKKCLARKVEIIIKGQTTTITLAPNITGLEEGDPSEGTRVMPSTFPGQMRFEPTIHTLTPFWLRPVLLQSKLVLISSDLARVKVTRHDPATGKTREWVVDCSKGGGDAPNLWLQDGDRIEVPEKPYASSAQAQVNDALANGGGRPNR